MKITILGCGASKGVPIIGCNCEVCTSPNIKNKRGRTAILIEKESEKILVDAGADFREQALAHNIQQVNAILFTHRHADHTAGAADLAALSSACEEELALPIYGNQETLDYLMQLSPYLFKPPKRSVGDFTSPDLSCYLQSYLLECYKVTKIGNLEVIPILQYHGDMNSLGFIIDDFAYCTDVKSFYPESWDQLIKCRLKVLVIACIGYKETFKHVHFDLLMEWIEKLEPETAILTHMGHTIEYDDIKGRVDLYVKQNNLKTRIFPAYDGLVFEM